MLVTNYIKSAWRNILRHKLFSIINIMGLAIGLAAVMLIALYVRYETSYDSFWKNADNIYRPHTSYDLEGMDTVSFARMASIQRSFLLKDFPEIEKVTRIMPPFPTPTLSLNNEVYEENVVLVDPEIIDIFDFTVIAGNIENSLKQNNHIILSTTLAKKHFGDDDPIGKTLSMDFNIFSRDYIVGAVIDDVPQNSMLDFTAMALLDENDFGDHPILTNDLWPSSFTYFMTGPSFDIDEFNSKLPEYIDRNFTIRLGVSDNKKSDVITIEALPLKDLHFKSYGEFETKPRNDINTIYIYIAVSFLILLIASINFMNLSTARATLRAKEIGLRKLVGAAKRKLVVQFLSESVVYAFTALLIGLVLVEVSIPFYADIIKLPLTLEYDSYELLGLLILPLIVGLLAGIYPAFILSGLRPASMLKSNQSTTDRSSNKFRNILVIIQFTISTVLFVSTAVIYYQLEHLYSKDLGFNKENLLILPVNNRDTITANKDSLINTLKALPNVESVTTAGFTLASEGSGAAPYYTEQMDAENAKVISYKNVGYDFFKTYDIPIIAGRTYDPARKDMRPTREAIRNGDGYVSSIIVNRSALRNLNLGSPEDAIGTVIYEPFGEADEGLTFQREIIGVIDDLNLNTLKLESQPETYDLNQSYIESITIRFTDSPFNITSDVQKVWENVIPGVPFKYDHVIDKLINQYLAEKGQMTMFAAFSGLAIFIACLGLFGLASFTAERRTKEIGIRKVFGAEVFQIVRMLVFQFSKPVLIANIIAWPIAYLAMSRWLESFVYRIDDMVIIALCLLAGLTALLIAWATVAGNSYAVARKNPIKALRYE
ncbi:ABC transporter permease [Pseudemcibacter aquimaris]|uniref:ABC transporter permease n=1 Tax=Pseudemcibacter aquimaris TaxID=2857064 RepID=UPI002013980E|nr:ABC transporter permease [Pseudemcibacter aquimaris]MCC3859887.1 ABC transporter permease [Pseudemcibacter aquimaris]WDU57219.1 ABC transporter permease [Pseudemcibacter aquimaris]